MNLPMEKIDAWVLPLEQQIKLAECRQNFLVEEEMNLCQWVLK